MRTSLVVIAVTLMGSTLAFAGGEKGAIRVEGLDVPATVWVDGAPAGRTPRTLVLPAGDHVISVRARGFAAFDSKVELAPDAVKFVVPDLSFAAQDDPVWLARVSRAARVGARGREAGLSRDGTRGADLTLYWPRGDVRVGALSTYRIDVGHAYFGNGLLQFKVNGRLVHVEAFRAKPGVHVAEIPSSVRRILRPISRLTWGVHFLGSKRGLGVMSTVRVTDGDRLDRRLAALTASRSYQNASTRMQEAARIRKIVESGNWSEGLQRSLAVLGVWPDADTLLAPMLLACCRRLEMEDTKLGRWVGLMSIGGAGKLQAQTGGRTLRAPRLMPDTDTGTTAPQSLVPWTPPAIRGEVPFDGPSHGVTPVQPEGAGIDTPESTEPQGEPAPESAPESEPVRVPEDGSEPTPDGPPDEDPEPVDPQLEEDYEHPDAIAEDEEDADPGGHPVDRERELEKLWEDAVDTTEQAVRAAYDLAPYHCPRTQADGEAQARARAAVESANEQLKAITARIKELVGDSMTLREIETEIRARWAARRTAPAEDQ